MAVGVWAAVVGNFERPMAGEALMELFFFVISLWIAVVFGVFAGWMWKPKWAFMASEKLNRKSAVGMVSLSSAFQGSMMSCNSFLPWSSDGKNKLDEMASEQVTEKLKPHSSSSQTEENRENLLTIGDLEHLQRLVQETDGGPDWQPMMNRSLPGMRYQAWRRDPKNGPPQYRSSTVFEDASPELVRDFFWDDEFRPRWDDMLAHSATLEECPITGEMVVQWIRKFPFFCSDREYIIGRRIWDSGTAFYCVTKGVPCSSVPRRNKPRRVDTYYSSWCIRPVETGSGDGQRAACGCEVLLFHHEEMGIPWEIAKMGVRQGMWAAVKKLEPALRAYQVARTRSAREGLPLSKPALMAQISTRISVDAPRLKTLNSETISSEREPRNFIKFIAIAGAVAVACSSLDRGILANALAFGVARRFPKLRLGFGRKL